MSERKKVPQKIVVAVLTEAGYRCAVPTCRTILAIDLHHMLEVSEGGGNEQGNLLPLCPTCHALYHRGEIKRESIYTWKSVLISLSQAFDLAAFGKRCVKSTAARLKSSGVQAGIAEMRMRGAYGRCPPRSRTPAYRR